MANKLLDEFTSGRWWMIGTARSMLMSKFWDSKRSFGIEVEA